MWVEKVKEKFLFFQGNINKVIFIEDLRGGGEYGGAWDNGIKEIMRRE